MPKSKTQRIYVSDAASLGSEIKLTRHPPDSKWAGCVEILIWQRECGCPGGHIMLTAKDWAKITRKLKARRK